MACEGFVFNRAAFRENHFIWGVGPFISGRDDYYDYPYCGISRLLGLLRFEEFLPIEVYRLPI